MCLQTSEDYFNEVLTRLNMLFFLQTALIPQLNWIA